MKNKFYVVPNIAGLTSNVLMVNDYQWWTENEREILNWMVQHLPRGIEHQQGMTIEFDSDQDRMFFLLKWAQWEPCNRK